MASGSDIKDIVAVGAGKGGVGKSMVSMHLAVGLRRRGAAVGLLDADVYGPSIATLAGIADAQPSPSPTPGDAGTPRIRPFDAGGIKVMSMANFVAPGQAMIWRGPMVHGVVQQFLRDVDWGHLDYLVVDLPPGTGDVPLTLAQTVGVTGAVIVTTPQPLALADAMRAARMYAQLGIAILGVVENMSYFACPACGAEHDVFGRGGAARAAAEAGYPLLAEIPLDLALRANTDAARADDDFDRPADDPVAAAVAAMTDGVVEQVRQRRAAGPPPEPIAMHRPGPPAGNGGKPSHDR